MNKNSGPSYRIAAVLTCHNRKEHTLACLRSLQNQTLTGWDPPVPPPAVADSRLKIEDSPIAHLPSSTSTAKRSPSPNRYTIEGFLVDDGSTDGTTEAVCEIWPEATVISGDGNLFWCGGMRVAWKAAAESDPDFYLLLNDDTTLAPHAIEDLLKIAANPQARVIVAGAVADPESGQWTYGGVQSQFSFPMEDAKPRPCGTLNMNVALVPRVVFHELGVLHHQFRHAMGDLDYGLQARRRGIDILETPNFVGTCRSNSLKESWRDTKLSRSERLRKLTGVKGLPFRDWLAYTRRNCGSSWIRYFLSPYLRVILGK